MEKEEQLNEINAKACASMLLPVRDALQILHGRWKLPIIISLTFGTRRFKQIANELTGITDKMLSKELKDLEANQLIKRTVRDTFPPTVEYSITEHGKSLQSVMEALRDWGMQHRAKIMKPGNEEKDKIKINR